MAYYIISFDPERMTLFQKRFDFLANASWVKDKKDLQQPPPPGVDAFYFVHLTANRNQIDESVLTIRKNFPHARVIYVLEDGKLADIKSHQLTPVGGDAYVMANCQPSQLAQILEGLSTPDLNLHGNRLESSSRMNLSAQKGLQEMSSHPRSQEIQKLFDEVFRSKKKPGYQSMNTLVSVPIPDELEFGEDDMSDKDQELSLDDLGDLELGGADEAPALPVDDGGMDLDLGGGDELDLSAPDEVPEEASSDDGMDLDLGGDLDFADDASESDESEDSEEEEGLSLGEDDDEGLSLGEDESAEEIPDLDIGGGDDVGLDLSPDDGLSLSDDLTLDAGLDDLPSDIDLSDDAKEKLKEIDAIMDLDASQVGITLSPHSNSDDDALSLGDDDDTPLDLGLGGDDDVDVGLSLVGDEDDALSLGATSEEDIGKPLVADDLDLGSLNFSQEEEEEAAPEPVKEKKKAKESKEVRETRDSHYDQDIGRELKEISGAYSGEMERMQATLSNLRTDREELLARISKLEEDKLLQSRQNLTLRAELDEKKIELSIIRKKLNDEISELKDRAKLHEEKKLILEEKNRILMGELDKSAQKSKIDVKKVMMRERELEGRLELLKADSETQIRNRDLKILELKRKIDSMEFDMESITTQEKRSVESRFELEDKLDKAIKTLRNAISTLEDESDKTGALDALKKNIDM